MFALLTQLALFAFPEGTRSHSAVPTLLPFKKGIFHLALQNKMPIVPVVCENYNRLYDNKTRFEGGDIRVAALPPISTEGMGPDDVDKLIALVHDKMFERLLQFDRERDAEDVNSTLHPSGKKKARVGGLAGLAARLIGDGGSHAYNHMVRKVERDESARAAKAGPGTDPNAYGLLAASDAGAPAV